MTRTAKETTTLRRAPGLVIHLDSSNGGRIYWNGSWRYYNRYALQVLGTLDRDRTIEEVFAVLQRQLVSRRATTEALTCLQSLLASGIVRTNEPSSFTDQFYPLGGYDSEYVHIAMLNDDRRKSAFIKGIQSVVKPGDVVVDLGTGSGILAIAAARAGARHVYAIEPSEIGDLARRVFEANGFSDRISLVRGWGADIELPEPADVLVTDIVGNDPFDMSLLEVIKDARERLLKPEAKVVPSAVQLWCQAAWAPQDLIDEFRISTSALEKWRSDYQIDFTELSGAEPKQVRLYERPAVTQTWASASDSILVGGLALTGDTPPSFEWKGTLSIREPGANVVVGYLVADLGSVRLSTAPQEGNAASHWYNPVWGLARPVEAGSVELTYNYVAEGRSTVALEPLR